MSLVKLGNKADKQNKQINVANKQYCKQTALQSGVAILSDLILDDIAA